MNVQIKATAICLAAVQNHQLTVGLTKTENRRFFGNASGANHVGDAFHLLFALLPPGTGNILEEPPRFFLVRHDLKNERIRDELAQTSILTWLFHCQAEKQSKRPLQDKDLSERQAGRVQQAMKVVQRSGRCPG